MGKNLLLICSYVICVTFAQLLLKTCMSTFIGMKVDLVFFLRAFSLPKVLVGAVLYTASFFIWLIILSKMEITFAYPLLSISVVLVAVISWITLGETFNYYRLGGILFTLTGTWLVIKS